MIAKQSKGRGFRGTLSYVLGKEGAEVVGGNMLGEGTDALAREFAASRALKPNVTRAVYHVSLAAAPGERLSDSKWNQVAGEYLSQMGFGESQFVAVRHTDTDHDHIHIVASRIGMDGKVVSESNDYSRSEKVLRGIEIEHGLTRVANSRDVDRRAVSRGEIELAGKGQVSTRLRMQGILDATLGAANSQDGRPTNHENQSVGTWVESLRVAGMGVIPNEAKSGHISGVTYVLDGQVMKGSDLGRGYTWAGIQKRGVNYEHSRDGNSLGGSRQYAKSQLKGHDRAVEGGAPSLDREANSRIGTARSRDGGFIRRTAAEHGGPTEVERGVRPGGEVSAHTSHSRGRDFREEPKMDSVENRDPSSRRRVGIGGPGYDRLLQLAAKVVRSQAGRESVAGVPRPMGAPHSEGSRHDPKAFELRRTLDLILGVDYREHEEQKAREREVEFQAKQEREKEARGKTRLEREQGLGRSRGRGGMDFSL